MHDKILVALCLASWGLALAQPVAGQSYPGKPVRAIVSSTAGGPLDIFTRLVTERMSERLKQPFVIVNSAGAGGNIAASAVAKAPADGLTVLFSLDTTFTVNPSMYSKIPFDPEKDFAPVSVLATFGQMLAVHPSLPVASVRDLATLSRERSLNYASAGSGFPSHLTFAYLQSATGIRATHIPYKGNPPMLLALLSGEVHAAMSISTTIIPQAKAGKLKMLAFSDSKRSLVAPEVPTVAESGYPGFEATFAYVLLAPAGTSESIVSTLHQEAARAVTSADVRERLAKIDVVSVGQPPARSAAWLRAARQKWGPLVQQLNIRAE